MRSVGLIFALFAALGMTSAAQANPVTLDPVEIGPELSEKVEDYGQRDIDRLVAELTEAISDRLERDGNTLVETDGRVRVSVTLEDAWPNRPTHAQLGAQPGLSFRSISLGGASVSAILYDADGTTLGELDYSWRTRRVSDSVGRGTWSDARHTFDRFARQISEELPSGAS